MQACGDSLAPPIRIDQRVRQPRLRARNLRDIPQLGGEVAGAPEGGSAPFNITQQHEATAERHERVGLDLPRASLPSNDEGFFTQHQGVRRTVGLHKKRPRPDRTRDLMAEGGSAGTSRTASSDAARAAA